MTTKEFCLCGASVDVTESSLRKYGEPHAIIGCKACKFTGRKPMPVTVGAIIVNGSK